MLFLAGVWGPANFGGSASGTSAGDYKLDANGKRSNYDPLEKRAESGKSYSNEKIGAYVEGRRVVYVDRNNVDTSYLADRNRLKIDENSSRYGLAA
ncbi:hypothetical protein AUJ84_01685 [Candidatus Pacearchaeota archaeon CG1_02_32_132]|nr:MAG: hypothetical protein AUJ84_01685 [Candidatus Pacearchaeota archaeon CG1_02_32_132]